MRFIVGTSGWMYRHWNNGVFYPPKVQGIKQLPYYASQFQSVEINSTFYHLPSASSVQNWYQRTPDDFVFAVKLYRFLTHTKKMVCDAEFERLLTDFFSAVSHLRHKLGVLLVQLPPSLRLAPERLDAFAAAMAKIETEFGLKVPVAIEFRHASWFVPASRSVLRRHNFAQVIIDSPGRWPADRHITADFTYLRFHGSQRLYHSSYSQQELVEWMNFIKQQAKTCQTVFAYFNNDFSAHAIANAKTFQTLVGQSSGD